MYLAYSEFSSAPEITTAYILSAIIGSVLKLPIAKMLNLWGRAEGFLVFEAVYLLGIIVIATCNDANGFAAGYVLYWIGYDAVYFIMDVFVADTSGLKNRAFAFAFVGTPFICTAFTGPLAAQSFLTMTSWRVTIGVFAAIMFCTFTPLAIIFKVCPAEIPDCALKTNMPLSVLPAQGRQAGSIYENAQGSHYHAVNQVLLSRIRHFRCLSPYGCICPLFAAL